MKEYAEALKRMQAGLPDAIKEYSHNTAEAFKDVAKANTPVDTGAMQGAWEVQEVEQEGSTTTATVVNNMSYASFVDRGTKFMKGAYIQEKAKSQVEATADNRWNIKLDEKRGKWGL
ncbi:MAG: HK97 gp10 family phage protein [Defluviitaleaceae bacterium]|nr:HK97 gp10 family phage protein [Defluviitaleaceae bacterium]